MLGERPLEMPQVQNMVNALFGLGQPLYGRPTPDGYPLTRSEWASRRPAHRRASRWRARSGYRVPVRIPADLVPPLGGPTREDARQGGFAPREWNMLLLASPEFMQR